ncbi:MAG: metal-dependent hydrolase [Promethearchaeota archaeon]
MDGTTHMMYGIILSEIIYFKLIKGKKIQQNYNRVQIWLLAAFGGFVPDFDGLPGIFQYLIGNLSGDFVSAVKYYHRDYSHGLLFLGVFILIAIISYKMFKKQESTTINAKEIENNVATVQIDRSSNKQTDNLSNNRIDKEILNPLGFQKADFDLINLIFMILFLIGNLIYTTENRILVSFLILIFLTLFAFSFAFRQKKPIYGLVIGIGAISHIFLDFFRGKIQPFGPWDPSFKIGLWIYPAGSTDIVRFIICYLSFEVSADIIAIYLIIRAIKEYLQFKKRNQQ